MGTAGELRVFRKRTPDAKPADTPDTIATGRVLKNPRLGTFFHGFLMIRENESTGYDSRSDLLALQPLHYSRPWAEGFFRVELDLEDDVTRIAAALDLGKLQPGFKNAVVIPANKLEQKP